MSVSTSTSTPSPSSPLSLEDEERPLLLCTTNSPATTVSSPSVSYRYYQYGSSSSSSSSSPESMMNNSTCMMMMSVVVEEEEDNQDEDPSAAANALLQRQLNVSRRMRVLTFFAAIGGFLSGYNTGVIAGALLPLKRVFALSAEQEEAIVSATIISACIASSIAMGGTLNTYYGRRGTLLLAAAIFTVGGALLFVAQNYTMLLVGEILLGMGIGLESLTSPLYIAEVAKPSIRGKLVSAYALMMCLGQFVAGIMDGVYGAWLPDRWAWRFMFGTAMLPGITMFVGFLGLPESPSWLMMQTTTTSSSSQRSTSSRFISFLFNSTRTTTTTTTNSTDNEEEHDNPELQAQRILQSVRDTDQEVELELQSLRLNSMAHNNNNKNGDKQASSSSSVWQSFQQMLQHVATRNALFVGCGLMILQQICGVNGVLYYAASVYEMAGFGELTSIWLSAFTAFAQIIGLALAVVLIETAGRRVLVICSLVGIGVASLGLGWSFYAARIYSAPTVAMYVDPACAQQPALVWDGRTQNCWDCASIPGCGFCGNACVRGTPEGPLFFMNHDNNNNDNHNLSCPAGTETEWSYSVCENPYGYWSVVFMVLYLIVFGMGMAGLPWTVNSEIYPVRYRSLAVSFSTGTNWLSNLLVSSTFLTLNSPAVLTSYGSFYLYAALCFAGAAAMYWYMPETKGLSMEQIEAAFEAIGNNSHNNNNSSNNNNKSLLPTTGEQQALLASFSTTTNNNNNGTFGTTCSLSSTAKPNKQQQQPGCAGDDTVLTCDSSDVSCNETSETLL